MNDVLLILSVIVSLIAAGAAIWAALTARAVLKEQQRQTQIELHVSLTIVEPDGELRLFVQNVGRVAATVTHIAVQIDTPRLQGEHRERLEKPMRLTLAWQLAPARSTEISMVSLPDLSEALLSISISRADLIGLAWDQDGALHRSEPLSIKAIDWRGKGKRPDPVDEEPADETGAIEVVDVRDSDGV